LSRPGDPKSARVADLMTKAPRTIAAERLAADCIVLMETAPKITSLLVVDAAGTLVGAVQMHDLFRARVV
jgi:arabinose-5-phosphate isomerase